MLPTSLATGSRSGLNLAVRHEIPTTVDASPHTDRVEDVLSWSDPVSGGVFLKRGDGLIEMVEQPYELEDRLQELIERHPNLLAGDQVNPDVPRRWLVLSREAGLASEEDGAARWSVDHLLLDQDAIPTIVEVKRSSDSRIRREVVGQMLDYAANAVTYWSLDVLRERWEELLRGQERDPDAEIAALLDEPAPDYDEFWERAKTNLRAGRIRLVFVADVIPTELQRVVEFLNERMEPTEVLAVEIRQYIGGGEQMLVPRVIGQTAEARQKKSVGRSRGSRQWDEPSFLADLQERRGPDEAEVARQIIEWSKSVFSRLAWGKGSLDGGVSPALDQNGQSYWPFYLWTYGRVEIQFYWMTGMPPFDKTEKRLEFLNKLNEIPGVELPESAILKRPAIPLSTLTAPDALPKLYSAVDWFLAEATRWSDGQATKI